MKTTDKLLITRNGPMLITKVQKIKGKTPNTPGIVKETSQNAKMLEIKNKKPNITNLVTKTYFSAKITEIENKIQKVVDFKERNLDRKMSAAVTALAI